MPFLLTSLAAVASAWTTENVLDNVVARTVAMAVDPTTGERMFVIEINDQVTPELVYVSDRNGLPGLPSWISSGIVKPLGTYFHAVAAAPGSPLLAVSALTVGPTGHDNAELLVVDRDTELVHRERDILVFDVRDSPDLRGRWFGKWKGAVRPVLDWTTERIEDPITPSSRTP